jgi:hypothetical protein
MAIVSSTLRKCQKVVVMRSLRNQEQPLILQMERLWLKE